MRSNMTKSNGLKSFSADLKRIKDKPLELVEAILDKAVDSAEHAYVEAATGASTLKPSALKMRHSVRIIRGQGASIVLRVSGKHSPLSAVTVRPGVDVVTTGKARQAISVQGLLGRPPVTLERGFIWSRAVFVRPSGERRKFRSASSLLSKAGARPSPAYLLGKTSDDVVSTALSVISSELDKA